MKIRCIDKVNPPCRRCRSLDLTCSFNAANVAIRPVREKHELVAWSLIELSACSSRVSTLESEMKEMRATLWNVTSLLHRVLGTTSTSPLSGRQTATEPPADPSSTAHAPPPLDVIEQAVTSAPERALTLAEWAKTVDTEASVRAQPSLDLESRDQPVGPSPSSSHLPPLLAPAESHTEGAESLGQHRQSSEEEDFLTAAATRAPMQDVLLEDETMRLRSDGHWGEVNTSRRLGHDGSLRKRQWSPDEVNERPIKQSRLETGDLVFPRDQELPSVVRRGDLTGAYPDPVELGVCSEQEGIRLFNLCVCQCVSRHTYDLHSFFEGASAYLPVYDPSQDTWTE
jgi:hypothetical protein